MSKKHHIEVRVMIVVDGMCYDETRIGGRCTPEEMATGEHARLYAESIRESLIRLHHAIYKRPKKAKDPTP